MDAAEVKSPVRVGELLGLVNEQGVFAVLDEAVDVTRTHVVGEECIEAEA